MTLSDRPRVVLAGLVAISVAAWTLAAWVAWFSYDLTFRLPGRDALAALGDMAQSTSIFDAADRQIFTIFKEQRIEIPLSRVSPHLRRAVVAIEDQRYFDHRGVDLIRVAAAALANLREGRRAQGGSPDHPAAGSPGVPQPRQDDPPQAEGSHPRGADRA